MRHTRTIIKTAATVAIASAMATVGFSAQAEAATTVPVSAQVFSDARSGLQKMITKSSSTDTQYLQDGRFRFGGAQCDRCELGPAVAAAALYRRTGDVTMKNVALNVMDTAINRMVAPNGSFSDNGGIQTVFFANHLGMMLYAFGPTLDATHKATYVKTLSNATDSLVRNGMNTFYVNGNINIATTVDLGMTYKFTGNPKYKALYDASLAFTLNPNQTKWKGYGLKLTSNNAGYLAENGNGGTGYDPDYTQFQTDIATQGYVAIGDPRLLTLATQLSNQQLKRVDTTNWTLDTTNGTRHAANQRTPYITPALLITAPNTTQTTTQTLNTARFFNASADNSWNGIYQGWGTQFATIIMTIQ